MEDLSISNDSSTNYSSMLVTKMFQKRKKSFGKSLQQILIQVSHDEVVRHLLQDRSSSQFIIGRIEEIIKSILISDREQFIDILLEKIQNYESHFNQSHAQSVMAISDKLLSVTEEQNSDEITNLRKVQTLVEQIKALQAQIVELRAKETEKVVNLEDIKKVRTPMDRYAGMDANSPMYYHFYANCDITEFELKVKLINTDVQATKEMLTTMCRKVLQIFQIVKEKLFANMRVYTNRMIVLEKDLEKSKSKIIELQSHFDQAIIPQLLDKQKESATKHKKMLKQSMQENEQLKSQLNDAKSNNEQLTSECQSLKTALESLQNQHESDEIVINNLQEEKQSNKHTIELQAKEIESLKSQLEQIKQTNNKNSKDLIKSMEENNKLKQLNSQKEKEISKLSAQVKTLNYQLPQEKEAAREANQKLDEAKQQNQQLTDEIYQVNKQNKNLDDQITDLESKYEVTQNELNLLKEQTRKLNNENETKAKQIKQQSMEIDDFNEQISQLKMNLSQVQSKAKQQEYQISNQEMEKRNLESIISDNNDKINQANQTNDKLKRELANQQDNSEKQNTRISQLTKQHNDLQHEYEELSQKNSKCESDIRNLKENLSNAEEENQKLSSQKQQMQQQIQQKEIDNETLNKQIKELSKQLKDVTSRADESESIAQSTKKQNSQYKDRIDELEEQNRQLNQLKEKNQKTIQNLEDDVSSLNNKQKSLSEKLKQQTEINMDHEKEIDSIQSANQEMQKVLNPIQKLLQKKSIRDLPDEIERISNLAQVANRISDNLGIEPNGNLVDHCEKLKKESEALAKITTILPSKNLDDLVNVVQKIKVSHDNLKGEHDRLSTMVSSNSSVDITKQIEELIEKQNQISGQLAQAGEFISLLLSIFTGSSQSQTHLVFPLKKAIETKLLDLVTRLKNRADRDREQIDKAIEKARSYGYEGEDIIEAAEFYVQRESENERQQTLSIIGRELGDVRNLSASEMQSYAQKNEELKKKNQKLRETMTEQNEAWRKKEDSLHDEIDQLQKENRQLQSDLATEKKLREEFSRYESGLPADFDFVKAKLSKNEK